MMQAKAIQRAKLVACVSLLGVCAPLTAQATPGAPFTKYAFWDAQGRLLGEVLPDPDGAGPLPNPASRYSYDPDGRIVLIEVGTVTGVSSADLAAATVFQKTEYTYNAVGEKLRDVRSSRATATGSWTVVSIAEYSYDANSRPLCTANRMNPALFGAAPIDACTQGTPGSFGPDRISKNAYDAAGRLTVEKLAFGTALQQDYATYTYTLNDLRSSATDANGNRSEFTYDGFDRLVRWNFPSKTVPGQSSAADYESYGYDANDNRTSLRKRDGTTFTYSYDALDRQTLRDAPVGSSQDIFYGYDLLGQRLYERYASSSGLGTTYTYDKAGRVLTSSSSMSGGARVLTYAYDADNNRVGLTFSDGVLFTFSYDGLDRLTGIAEPGPTAVVAISYDVLGRRAGLTGGATTGYTYDASGRLAGLAHDLASTANDVTFSFSSYNPAGQSGSKQTSNDSYAWSGYQNGATAYQANGLNQYATVSGTSFGYDDNGNLTSDGTTIYSYDSDNRLTGASGSAPVAISYDPRGRMFQVSGGGIPTTQFLFDGDVPVAEYDLAGTLVSRYVYGSRPDEPLLAYSGSAVSTATRRNLRADQVGSIVAIIDSAGASAFTNRYDPYGRPAATNAGRFGFTGQVSLPQLAMYSYKSRVYAPALGRFLQTDPIGYEDDLNLYAYSSNDPINRIDPTGEKSWLVTTPFGPTGVMHTFVVVADQLGGPVIARFSYGPAKGAPGAAVGFLPDSAAKLGLKSDRLVSVTGSGTIADQADRSSWAMLADPTKAAKAGVYATEINAADSTVIRVGTALDEYLGTPQSPGMVDYETLPHSGTSLGELNSNSAAYAVAIGAQWVEGASNVANPDTKAKPEPKMPPGTRAPGWRQFSRLLHLLGVPFPKGGNRAMR